jgi:hypothetical protein
MWNLLDRLFGITPEMHTTIAQIKKLSETHDIVCRKVRLGGYYISVKKKKYEKL